MTQAFNACIGATCSADIAVPDHEQAVRFYARVLGTGAEPLWREDLMNNLGLPVIGLGERSPEYAELPLQWMPHIQVADVAQSVQRSESLDGRTLLHERDEQGQSQWAVLLDPSGAAFGIIPVIPAAMMPAEARNADAANVGCIAWLDLTVADAVTTRDFYAAVIGWTVEDVPMGQGPAAYADFNMLGEAGTAAAGVCHARDVNLGLPPVWLLYLPVGDLAESLRRVREEGGQVIKTMQDSRGELVYAAVTDPVGASFALVQAAGSAGGG